MTAEEIAHKIFYMPATNGKAGISLKEGTEMIETYAREAIKADRERVAAAATLLIEKTGGKVLTGQLKYIAYDGDHFEIDKSSILNLPIELPTPVKAVNK